MCETRTAVSMLKNALENQVEIPTPVCFCNVWLGINSTRNIPGSGNDGWSLWTEILEGQSLEGGRWWPDNAGAAKSHQLQWSQGKPQLQVQFPHWNVAMTWRRLSPCTKSCNSSWPGAFKALLVFHSSLSHTTQSPAVPSCQSVLRVEHQQELMPIPGAVFSPCWPTAARKAQPLSILWNEMGSFWQNINKPLRKTATKVLVMELPQNLNTPGSIINCSHATDGEKRLVIREQCT